MAKITLRQLAEQIVQDHGFTLERDIKDPPSDLYTQLEDYCSVRLARELMQTAHARKPSTLGILAFERPSSEERAKYYFYRIRMDMQDAGSAKGRLWFAVMIALLVEVEAVLKENQTMVKAAGLIHALITDEPDRH